MSVADISLDATRRPSETMHSLHGSYATFAYLKFTLRKECCIFHPPSPVASHMSYIDALGNSPPLVARRSSLVLRHAITLTSNADRMVPAIAARRSLCAAQRMIPSCCAAMRGCQHLTEQFRCVTLRCGAARHAMLHMRTIPLRNSRRSAFAASAPDGTVPLRNVCCST